ncbi:MAG: HU family DNA-binding protein [Candidatus Competibacteraceae bacterium]|nr:HU family DNA-binding protein [Candidatus Competibacteraceae bacterium]
MSTPSTTFRVFYPDTNTVTALNLFDATGAALTPQTLVDGADDPVGFKSKVVTFAAASEPLLATPTFSNPAAPVSLYLTRDDAGTFKKVLDETVFDAANPGRPTASATSAQEWRLYEVLSNVGGVKTYGVMAPSEPVAIVKALGKDPITGEPRLGNDILVRWTGLVADRAEIEADIEDIVDPQGYLPFATTNVTTYAESSVGLSLLQVNSQIVPQNGLTHLVKFRVRYNIDGDISAWAETSNVMVSYAMPSPNAPASFNATLLRDRMDDIPDVIKIEWTKDGTVPGDGIEVYAYDFLDKKHTVYSSNGIETEARIENVSRFIVQDEPPAVQRPYRFSIVSTNISGKSAETAAPAPLNITSKVKPVTPLTPDEVAGTAREVDYATLKAEVFADVVTALGALPTEGSAIVSATVDKIILKIKDVVMKGGSVDLLDFGVMAAKWTNERLARNPSTGEPIVVPPYRNLGFSPSIGFKTGTKNGAILTDAQAKAL